MCKDIYPCLQNKHYLWGEKFKKQTIITNNTNNYVYEEKTT